MMNKKSVYMLLAAVLVCSMGAELAGIHLHSPSWWTLPFGYNIFFGFIGCWLLIIGAKLVMGPLLQRDEAYYDNRGDDDE